MKMESLRLALLVLHFFGFAALLGGLLVQVRDAERKVNLAMRNGVGAALIAGILLVAALEGSDQTVNQAKIAVKLGIGLIVLFLVIANRHKPRLTNAVFYAMLTLTIANICVAVFWSSAHT